MPPFPLVPNPNPLGAAYVPILLSEVEQEQRPCGNGDQEAIVVGAGLYDGEGERAYTVYDPILGEEKCLQIRLLHEKMEVRPDSFDPSSTVFNFDLSTFRPFSTRIFRPVSWHPLRKWGYIQRTKTMLFENATYSTNCPYKIGQTQRDNCRKISANCPSRSAKWVSGN